VDFELGAPQAAGKPAPGPKAQAPAPSGIKPAAAPGTNPAHIKPAVLRVDQK
jgi:hypothetical protein